MGRTNTSHRRTQKSVGLKDTAKPINPAGQERDSSSNHRWLRCLIAFFVFGIILLKVIQSSPWKCSNAKSSSNLARSCFTNAGWGKWRRGVPDQRYTSNSHIQWAQILQITSKLDAEKKALNIGLLNFNSTEIKQWKNLFPTAEFSKIHLKKAGKELTWNDDLYPEWINEEKEEEFDFPSCPNLPDPEIPKSLQLGLVAVKLPCDKTSNWTRDIPRLHLQLAAAKLSVHSKEGNDDPAHVLVVTDCLPIPNLFSCKNNEWNYSKFRLWQLTEYDKIIFIDSDLLVLRNIDFLFTMPEISATGNNGTLFNSGVMVIEPSKWWHRIPRHMNFLKHFWIGDEEEKKAKKTHLFGAEPPVLYVLHYLGFKPWLCFRDYDCNWNVNFMQEFASDVAHQKWWRVHDSMPKRLQKFCLLSTQRKANLEWERRQAEKADYSDGHWKRNVTDARLRICKDDYCDWKSMLLHWGDP